MLVVMQIFTDLFCEFMQLQPQKLTYLEIILLNIIFVQVVLSYRQEIYL